MLGALRVPFTVYHCGAGHVDDSIIRSWILVMCWLTHLSPDGCLSSRLPWTCLSGLGVANWFSGRCGVASLYCPPDHLANRPRQLASVRRLTIGTDAEGGALFTLAPAPPLPSSSSTSVPPPHSGDGATAGASSSSAPLRLMVRPEIAPALSQLASTVELYLLTRVSSDEGEAEVVSALVDAGVVAAGMNVHKALFCETVEGRVSMVRQLEPQLALDEAVEVVDALGRFVKSVKRLDRGSAPGGAAPEGPGRTTLPALLE